ncbi:MAG TPA: hypothetical protein VLF39_03830 [Candidatus Saccharimonadales bacterium]|nr:hypothetical protein [Candidatus Saccharimonadales bacterium]
MATSKNKTKVNASKIKLYGPIPRTLGTLLTVLVVTSMFGLVGYRQLQSSHAQTLPGYSNQGSTQPVTYHYTATADQTPTAKSSYPSNFQTRLIFFSALIVGTIILIFLLRLWG